MSKSFRVEFGTDDGDIHGEAFRGDGIERPFLILSIAEGSLEDVILKLEPEEVRELADDLAEMAATLEAMDQQKSYQRRSANADEDDAEWGELASNPLSESERNRYAQSPSPRREECPGSGQHVSGRTGQMFLCPVCGRRVARSETGKIASHFVPQE